MNVRLAFRTLRRSPFVTSVAILSLALGIGANAAIFSLVNQLLLAALPVPSSGELVNLGAPGAKSGSTSCNDAGDCDAVFSYPMFRDLEKAQSAFTGIAAHRSMGANISYHGQTQSGDAMLVSGSYFKVLELRPALGRLLTPDDDRAVGSGFVAVLSHAYWTTHLGSDPGVINSTILVNGQSLTIVGVAPEGFDGTTLGKRPQIFVPITLRQQLDPYVPKFENRRAYWVYLFGRLRPGVSIDQARASLDGIYRPIITDVEAPLQKGLSEKALAEFRGRHIALEPGARGQSQIHTEARTPLLILFAITGVVLLIACANIANLLLARAANRSMEMAVRLSLGASRRQVVAQLLTESCLLAILGGVASLLVAKWTLAGIVSVLPSDAATTLRPTIDLSAIAFTGALAIATGVLFGIFPALHSTRPDLVTSIRANAGQIQGARSAARFRAGLATVQIALSMALLVPAGLFTKSLANVTRAALGIRIDSLVTFSLSADRNGYDPARRYAFYQRVEQEVAAIPGVVSVATARVPVLAGDNWNNDVSVEGYRPAPDENTDAHFNEVGPGYYRTLGIPLLAGREFSDGDVAGRQQVAVVNEAFTRRFKLGRDAVGKHIGLGSGDATKLDYEIVGVTKDAKYNKVKGEMEPTYALAARQDTTIGSLVFYARTSSSTDQLLRTIPSVVKRLDPTLPVEDLKSMPQQVKENVFLDRLISLMAAAFAILATILAAVGLYGVLAYTVAQRTREIGVRMALGADRRNVQRLVLGQVGRMALIGGISGTVAALAIGKAAASMLYQLTAYDPVVLAGAAVVLSVVALGAGYIPARRASRVDPMQALRYE